MGRPGSTYRLVLNSTDSRVQVVTKDITFRPCHLGQVQCWLLVLAAHFMHAHGLGSQFTAH